MKRTLENIKDPLFRFFEREVSFPKFCDLMNSIFRVRTGFGKFWEVMVIDNTIFQDLPGKLWKMKVFQNGYEKVLDFFRNVLQILKCI